MKTALTAVLLTLLLSASCPGCVGVRVQYACAEAAVKILYPPQPIGRNVCGTPRPRSKS